MGRGERLVRLSRSLDVLAEGDAPTGPGRRSWTSTWPRRCAARPSSCTRDERGWRHLPGRRASGTPGPGRSRRPRTGAGEPPPERAPYTPPGGSCGWPPTRPGEAVVSVANSGPGIPPDDLPHVFDASTGSRSRAIPAQGGAGIGLAIVRALVEPRRPRRRGVGRRATRIWFEPARVVIAWRRRGCRSSSRRPHVIAPSHAPDSVEVKLPPGRYPMPRLSIQRLAVGMLVAGLGLQPAPRRRLPLPPRQAA